QKRNQVRCFLAWLTDMSQIAAPFAALLCNQCLHPRDVVRGCSEPEDPVNLGATTVTKFSHKADVLHPAEALFDPLSLGLANLITDRACRSSIEVAVGDFSRNMRRDFQGATRVNEGARIVALVGTNCHAGAGALSSQHCPASFPFLACRGLGDLCFDDHAVAVLCQNMAHVVKLAFFAFSLAEQLRLWVSCRLVRLVATLLAMEVLARVIVIRAIFRLEGLHGSTGFQQGSIDAKVLTGHKLLGVSLFFDRIEEQLVNSIEH